mmetsp:Transcript_9539/g.20106  ORF Transcript_9539/g.20106 Transcript_9539/m.20106 type:complete len:283 (+) Transcript_9539:75-923(+)
MESIAKGDIFAGFQPKTTSALFDEIFEATGVLGTDMSRRSEEDLSFEAPHLEHENDNTVLHTPARKESEPLSTVTFDELFSLSEEALLSVVPDASSLSRLTKPVQTANSGGSPASDRIKVSRKRSLTITAPRKTQSLLKEVSMSPKTMTTSEGESVVKRTRNSSRKMTHSKFCHICSRPSERENVLACNRISSVAGCCKVVCRRCYEAAAASDVNWTSESFEEVKSKELQYTCSHCTNTCPPNARCHVYQRVNEKRRKIAQEIKSSSQALVHSCDKVNNLKL